MIIKMRDIAAMHIDDVINLYHDVPGPFKVEFDDGILEHSGGEIVFTRMVMKYWNSLPRDFQLVKKYSIAFDKAIDPNKHLALCGRIYKDYLLKYEFTEWDIDDEYMNRVVYEITNDLYNFFVTHLIEYTQGANVLDIIEILDHPDVKKANTRIQTMKAIPSPEDIINAQNEISTAILKSPALAKNSFAIALRCKSIKMLQMVMVVGPIGYCTDVNSSIFPYPITSGFYEGSNRIWQYAIESRTASIATLNNDLIMPEAQYANRRYQLQTQPIRWIVRLDCGTKNYQNVYVSDQSKLKNLAGSRVLNEETGTLFVLQGDENELIGKMIKRRSASHCDWRGSRAEFCAICHGQVYRALLKHPKGSLSNIKGRNAGHVSAIQIGERQSSGVLAKKHSNSTSVAAEFELGFEQSAYLNVTDGGRHLSFVDTYRTLDKLKLKLKRSQVEKLYDLKNGIGSFNAPTSTTYIENFTIIDMELDSNINQVFVSLGSKQRCGHLTPEALEYVVTRGWEFDDNRDIIVSLKDWDKDAPFFIIPQIELSSPEVIEHLTSFYLGPTDKRNPEISGRKLNSYRNIDDAIDAFYHVVAEHFDINYSHVALMVLAMSAQDPDNDDYRLPYPRDSGKIVTDIPMLYNSSAGMQMAYELQHKILSAPQSFVLHKRRGHPLDCLLLSKEYGNRIAEKIQSPLYRIDKHTQYSRNNL